MSEPFDLDAYLRCDCASVGNQTCDKCVVRSYIAALSRDLEEANALLTKAWLYTDLRQFQNEIVAFQQRISREPAEGDQNG